MSILDLIPESEAAAAVAAIVNERPFEPASANEVALRWCVMRLVGAPTEAPVADDRDAEIARLNVLLAQERDKTVAFQATASDEIRRGVLARRKVSALARLFETVDLWVNARGSAAQNDDALARAFHDCREQLEAIAAEERR